MTVWTVSEAGRGRGRKDVKTGRPDPLLEKFDGNRNTTETETETDTFAVATTKLAKHQRQGRSEVAVQDLLQVF